LLLFHSEYIVDPNWTWGDTPWCDFIFRQNKYLSNDWWPLSPSSPYQLSQHLNGILDSNNAYLLLALLPIPKFIHHKRPIRGMLEARLYHHCLDVVLAPLKAAAQLGVMLSDPLRNLCWCFTALASFIVDTPEAQLISCVGGKTSPVTMANYDQFGDGFRHPSRTGYPIQQNRDQQ
jgi:hypothetical protein